MMTRPTSTNTGFDSSQFGYGSQAQLFLMTGSNPVYEDGDILSVFNRRCIRGMWADNICQPRNFGFNSDGLRNPGTLPEKYQENAYQFRFERISATEVRRTDLKTLDQVVLGPTPTLIDGTQQYIFVDEFIARRKSNSRHKIFGSDGAEIWYGGKLDVSWTKLDTIWEEIESRSLAELGEQKNEVDHRDWPATARELSRFLIVSVNDFDDATAATLIEPLFDVDGETILKKRKNFIQWRQLRDTVEGDVLDPAIPVDIRGRKEIYQGRVEGKTS